MENRWAWLGISALVGLGLFQLKKGLSPPAPAASQRSQSPSSDWHELYLGGSLAAETELFKRFVQEIKHVQSQFAAREHSEHPLRAFHAKLHAGVTNAELRVRQDLPQEFQVGFFQPGAVYPAVVRLSNASSATKSDMEKDLRGLAVRVRLDGGREQDFLMTDAAASHARDARQFMVMANAQAQGSRPRMIADLVRGLGVPETVRMLMALRSALRVVDSLATQTYFGRAPFAFGPYAAKFRFQPATGGQHRWSGEPRQLGSHFLREELIERLKNGPVAWDLQVQRYVDPQSTPIEDGTVLWEEEVAPNETIAQLVIPQQDLTTEEAEQAAGEVDAMEFSPWNFTDGLRPLGSLNRARRAVYPASADFRADRTTDELLVESPAWQSVWAVVEALYRVVNRFVPWHHLPAFIGAVNLVMYRRELRRHNLHDTATHVSGQERPKIEPRFLVSRRSDGRDNDLAEPEMGSAGFRFGRNVPLAEAFPKSDASILDPNPREISERLLARKEFVPARTLNLHAASWIQFQVHDWVNHTLEPRDKTDRAWRIPPPEGDAAGEEQVVRRTQADETQTDEQLPPMYRNENSHWWDGSQIYGSDQKVTDSLRSKADDGKLAIDEKTNFLPIDSAGQAMTGFSNNWWVGLALLHNLFVHEHNAICDMLRREHPRWSGERIFDVARLINVALMAKIHTVEWTPAILAHPALQLGMDANWYGLEGRTLQRLFGRLTSDEVISGIPGSIRDHAGVPYALTEEFVSVYRLHPLIPDEVQFWHAGSDDPPSTLAIEDTAFTKAQDVLSQGYSVSDVIYSFAMQHPGAITLHNYPQFLRDLRLGAGTPEEEHLDLAAVDILRDRERGVPRYNRFRELLHRGRVRSFSEITSNREWAAELEQVYRDVDRVDLMVGMFAEDLPAGFGFSDTAFRIFILMASRRIKSDRFFTTDWRPEVYTQEGMDWISNNGMKTLLLRHYPELAPYLRNVKNAFAPWG